MRILSNRHRPVHLGAYPMERLSRGPLSADQYVALRTVSLGDPPASNPLAKICAEYAAIYDEFRLGDPAPERAPYHEAPIARSHELKAMAYFFDSTLVGICTVHPSAWLGDPVAGQTHALVLVVDYNDHCEPDNPVHDLIANSRGAVARLRAAEIAVILAIYVRQLGFSATAHTPSASDVSLPLLAASSGLVRWEGGSIQAPFLGSRIAVAAVTTELELAADLPLAPKRSFDGGIGWWLGVGGTETWWSRRARSRRPGEWGKYPMERIRRVTETTTLIIESEVPRLPKRAGGFARARMGDYGEKAAREISRFASKTPLGTGLRALQSALQPYQSGSVRAAVEPDTLDPVENRRALKTLAHHLGADVAGTCEAKPYAWYSHDYQGNPMPVRHRNALVIAIDQGFETMAGASGDDWVSGTQSYRAYLRGAQIVGVLAAYLRSMGHDARSHSNADSDVIQTPLVLLAGLGEMSRIGETVLNPFLGPRTKSAVLTTDLPLAWDQPVDFGLQDSCRKCLKCARECPCQAITFGGPVMFNGYEMWKHDVQRCTSYRVTNQAGSACGRCMKTCPYNREGVWLDRVWLWVGRNIPASRRWLARLDDRLGNGEINPVKHWWSDLEVVGGKVVRPKAANRRGLKILEQPARSAPPIAHNDAASLPPPNWLAPFPTNRKAETASASQAETAAQARLRVAQGGATPARYGPPAPVDQPPPPTASTSAPSPMHKG